MSSPVPEQPASDPPPTASHPFPIDSFSPRAKSHTPPNVESEPTLATSDASAVVATAASDSLPAQPTTQTQEADAAQPANVKKELANGVQNGVSLAQKQDPPVPARMKRALSQPMQPRPKRVRESSSERDIKTDALNARKQDGGKGSSGGGAQQAASRSRANEASQKDSAAKSRRSSSASRSTSGNAAKSQGSSSNTKAEAKADTKEAPQAQSNSWFDIFRQIYPILQRQFPDQDSYRLKDILKIVDAEWHSIRGEEKRPRNWRRTATSAIKISKGMFVKVRDKNEHYKMYNIDCGREDLKTEKEAQEEAVQRAVIPRQWANQQFKPVRLSSFDKAIALKVDAEQSIVEGFKGFRMVRATGGIMEGDWYYEVEMLPLGSEEQTGGNPVTNVGGKTKGVNSAVRIGWSTRRSDIETPVGFDSYGFALRDQTGEFIHTARRRRYGEKFGVSDIIGCRISLPKLTKEEKAEVEEAEKRWLKYRFIQFSQGPAPSDSGIDIRLRSKIEWFKNGISMGVPQFFQGEDKSIREPGRRRLGKKPPKREMKAGVYYPSVALFGGAKVKVRFGPPFAHAPPVGTQPISECLPDPIDVDAPEKTQVENSSNGEMPEVSKVINKDPKSSKEMVPKRGGFVGRARGDEQRSAPEPMAVEG